MPINLIFAQMVKMLHPYSHMALFLFFAGIFFSACSNKQDSVYSNIDHYFNLEAFMDTEAARLDSIDPTVDKAVSLNGKVEHQRLQIEDWKKELAAFKEADINKAALIGKYESDTLMSAGQLEKITYTAHTKDLKTQQLIIEYRQGKPSGVWAKLSTDNILYNSRQQLSYRVDEGYTMQGKQSIRWMGDDIFSIESNF